MKRVILNLADKYEALSITVVGTEVDHACTNTHIATCAYNMNDGRIITIGVDGEVNQETSEKAEEHFWPPFAIQQDVMRQAVETYGKAAQVDMAIEEMSELTKALLKERRANGTPDVHRALYNVYEEMADVLIMLEQMLMVFGGREDVQKSINEKTDRLAERLAAVERGTQEDDA